MYYPGEFISGFGPELNRRLLTITMSKIGAQLKWPKENVL